MMPKFLNFPQYHIGYSTNNEDRYKASSGGIGTAITRHLLSLPEYGTGITFYFDRQKCMYMPRLIHDGREINVCGSIYQDIDILRFLRENLDQIEGGIVLTAPPCQITAIRQQLAKRQIRHFILSYCCSGQTTVEGTWKYYELLGIDRNMVTDMQYRGNGWPSGIQIALSDGTTVRRDNYTEPWVTLHRSQLYRPQRCFFCKRDTGRNADIALADPWLEKHKKEDKIGSTLFLVNTEYGKEVFEKMIENGKICATPSSYDDYATAQKPNVQKEFFVREQTRYLKLLTSVIKNPLYRKWATKSTRTMMRHSQVSRFLKLVSKRKNMLSPIRKKFIGIRNNIRTRMVIKELGSGSPSCCIYNNVTITVPRCIYLGEKVGIGENTFLGPVTQYAGINYTPKIEIGSGTWVGKNCSIAAIHGVTIGKNVLFAGHVHITDHSHGYEDVTKPISPQPLTSKGPVTIEDDCWLGFSCEILSGVHIGKHSIVAARSVVTKDVPPYSIVAGNPARIVKQYNKETLQWERVKK